MAFTREELDRLVDDIRDRGVITASVYCGKCGYNLRTLPYVYQCPECGNEYNARPLSRRGIFPTSPYYIPLREMLATVVCVAGTITLVYSVILNPMTSIIARSRSVGSAYGLITLLGIFSIHFGWESGRVLITYRRQRRIARRIAEDENESTEKRGSPT